MRPLVISSIFSILSADKGLLVIPHARMKTKKDFAFQTLVPKLWNSLLLLLHTNDSVASFKKMPKCIYSDQQFGKNFVLFFLIQVCSFDCIFNICVKHLS